MGRIVSMLHHFLEILNYMKDLFLIYILDEEQKIGIQPLTNGSIPLLPQIFSVPVKKKKIKALRIQVYR